MMIIITGWDTACVLIKQKRILLQRFCIEKPWSVIAPNRALMSCASMATNGHLRQLMHSMKLVMYAVAGPLSSSVNFQLEINQLLIYFVQVPDDFSRYYVTVKYCLLKVGTGGASSRKRSLETICCQLVAVLKSICL